MPSSNSVARLIDRLRPRRMPPRMPFEVGEKGFDLDTFAAYAAAQSRPDQSYQALLDFWQIQRNRKVADLITAAVPDGWQYHVVERLNRDGIVRSVKLHTPGTCPHGLSSDYPRHSCPFCDLEDIPF